MQVHHEKHKNETKKDKTLKSTVIGNSVPLLTVALFILAKTMNYLKQEALGKKAV